MKKYRITFTIDTEDKNLCEIAIAMEQFFKYIEEQTEIVSIEEIESNDE